MGLSRLSEARNRFCDPVWRWPRVSAPSVSRRRAMVEVKRRSPWTSRGHDAEPGRRHLGRAVRPPEALDRLGGAPAGLDEIVPAAAVAAAGPRGRVVGPPGPSGVGEEQHRLGAGHEGRGLGRVGLCRPRHDLERPVRPSDRALRAARHLRQPLLAEVPDEAVEDGGDGCCRVELHERGVAQRFRLSRDDGASVVVDQALGHHDALDLDHLVRLDGGTRCAANGRRSPWA